MIFYKNRGKNGHQRRNNLSLWESPGINLDRTTDVWTEVVVLRPQRRPPRTIREYTWWFGSGTESPGGSGRRESVPVFQPAPYNLPVSGTVELGQGVGLQEMDLCVLSPL